MLDTSSEAALVQIEAQRRLGTAGRFRVAVDMSEFARDLARAGLRAKHPEWDEARLDRELLHTLYGVEILRP